MTLLVFVTWATICFGSSEALQQLCDNMVFESLDCECNDFGMTEVRCKAGQSDIVIRIANVSKLIVIIQCSGTNTPNDFDKYLPKVDLGANITINEFTIFHCPVPNSSFNEILSRLGGERTTLLKIFNTQSNTKFERRHFSHLKGVSEINYKGKFNYPSMDFLSDLTDLKQFKLSQGTEFTLTNETFTNMNRLQRLELETNQITPIPAGAFAQLKNLSTLQLRGNNHMKLKSGDFVDLENLQALLLHENEIIELPTDIFESLNKLKILSLKFNYFTSLPNDLFKNNKQLEDFKLIHNQVPLKWLPNRLLADLPNLQKVDFNNCGLEEIPPDLFKNSGTIKAIKLANNELAALPKELFENLLNLVTLDLSSNNIASLDEKIFEKTTSLQLLNLNENKIEVLDSTIFENQGSLNEFYISKNELRAIHPSCFINAWNLKKIDMSHNKLDLSNYLLNSLFNESSLLSHLDLSHNIITKFMYSNNWKYSMKSLQNLNLSYNNIVYITLDDFYTISKTITIDLRYNEINTIGFKHVETFLDNHKMSLEFINEGEGFILENSADTRRQVLVGNNPLKCDCTLYDFVRYLKLGAKVKTAITINTDNATCSAPIDKNETSLSSLDEQELTCLLGLPKQCPEECKCYFRNFTNSLIVDCKNKLKGTVPRFPGATGNATYIEVHLEENHLTYLKPGAFGEDVLYLNLSRNNLSSLEVGVIPKNIRVLDLRNNTLRKMSKQSAATFANGQNLEKLFIAGNPITCDCENFEFITNNHKKIADYNDVACDDDRIISEIAAGELCAVSSWIIALCVFIAIVGVSAGIMFAAYYKYNTEIKVYCYAKGWFLWFISEEELDKDKKYDAFICHSHKDEGFVITELLPNLECGPEPFKLCVHFRDWYVGELIPTHVVNSVNDSRRTIIILSANFLESFWGKLEFRSAHRSAIKEGRSRVIVIIYGEIGDVNILDRELQAYLTMNTYIKWGDPWFWRKLRFAMPHRNPNFNKHVESSPSEEITLENIV